MQRLWYLEHTCLTHAWKIHHSEWNGYHISGQHTNQNRRKLPDSFSKVVQGCYHSKGKESHQPVLPGAIIRIRGSTSHVVDRSGIQGKSDGKYHCSCNQRRKKYSDLFYHNAHDNGNNTAYNLGSQNGVDSVPVRNGLHTWYICEADTHNDGKSWTNPVLLPNGKKLE